MVVCKIIAFVGGETEVFSLLEIWAAPGTQTDKKITKRFKEPNYCSITRHKNKQS